MGSEQQSHRSGGVASIQRENNATVQFRGLNTKR